MKHWAGFLLLSLLLHCVALGGLYLVKGEQQAVLNPTISVHLMPFPASATEGVPSEGPDLRHEDQAVVPERTDREEPLSELSVQEETVLFSERPELPVEPVQAPDVPEPVREVSPVQAEPAADAVPEPLSPQEVPSEAVKPAPTALPVSPAEPPLPPKEAEEKPKSVSRSQSGQERETVPETQTLKPPVKVSQEKPKAEPKPQTVKPDVQPEKKPLPESQEGSPGLDVPEAPSSSPRPGSEDNPAAEAPSSGEPSKSLPGENGDQQEIREVGADDIVKKVVPRYPTVSRRRSEEGEVTLLAEVVAGAVKTITLERSSGYERLDGAAMQSVKAWRFRRDLTGTFRIPIVFRLK